MLVLTSMKALARSHPPPALRDDEEELIEAVIRWAAAERRLHGRLPVLPAKIATIAGEVVLRCDDRHLRVVDDEEDASVLRFRNLELT